MTARGSGEGQRATTGAAQSAVLIAIAAVLVVGAAVALLLLPPAIGYSVAIVVFPLAALALAILRKPLVGVLLIYTLEYFRPQDLVFALEPLRLPLLATVGVFLLLIIRVIRDREHLVHWPRQATTFALLLAFMAVSVITSTNNYWAFQFFRGMAITVMLFLLTVNFVRTSRDLRLLIGLLIAAHIFLCGKGVAQFALGTDFGTTGKVGGNFLADENDFALALVVIFPFAYFAIGRSVRAGGKAFWSAVTLLFLITIMLTMSRGGFLGIAATLIVCWAKSRRKALGLLGLVLLVSAVVAIAPAQYFDEIRSIKQTDEGTAHKRREYWMAGMRMYAEKPLIGVGPGNSKLFMPQYVDLPRSYRQWGRAMHGTLPLLLAEMGTIGFVLYGFLFAQSAGDLRAMRRARIEEKEEGRFAAYLENSIGASAVGFLVASTFLSALYYPHMYLLMAFSVIGRGLTRGPWPGGGS